MSFHINDHVFEWQLFCRVQPFFVSEIPWRLPNTEAESAQICVETFRTVFSNDMRSILGLCPKHNLPEGEYHLVLYTLTPLLEFLEGLILGTILEKANEDAAAVPVEVSLDA